MWAMNIQYVKNSSYHTPEVVLAQTVMISWKLLSRLYVQGFIKYDTNRDSHLLNEIQ